MRVIFFLITLGASFPLKGGTESPTSHTSNDRISVGAIRWDAWFGTDVAEGSQSWYTTKTLSPAKYHYRLPFFAEIKSDGTAYFPEYTQEIMDAEINYAAEAGIKYWAYVFYTGASAGNAMEKARKLHLTSSVKDKVKISCVFEQRVYQNQVARDWVREGIEAGLWMTVDGGRPLMFYMRSDPEVGIEIAYYKKMCEELGVPPPYSVLLNGGSKAVLAALGADAISNYVIGLGGGAPYSCLVSESVHVWNKAKNECPVIPCVTMGWDTRPRYDNPVPWHSVSSTDWVQEATNEEIITFFKKAFEWVYENRETAKAKTILTYAWNENDEGGWITPTLAVDSEGKQLFNEDSSKKLNFSKLNAVAKAIAENK